MTETWEQARAEHRGRQQDAIAMAALSLVLEHGASALTMAAIADAAGVSRQTLYRYFPDIDAVLAGIAELVTSHDDHLESAILEQPHPRERLDTLLHLVAAAGGHDHMGATALRATLPPAAREVLARHERRVVGLLADVLRAGVERGDFRPDLDPDRDAPLVLGLVAAADPADADRAVSLAHRLIDPEEKQP